MRARARIARRRAAVSCRTCGENTMWGRAARIDCEQSACHEDGVLDARLLFAGDDACGVDDASDVSVVVCRICVVTYCRREHAMRAANEGAVSVAPAALREGLG